MPATLCSQCEGAIPRDEYRVIVVAAARDRRFDVDVVDIVETTRTLTFCQECAMAMPQFTIINDFKRHVELRAKWLQLPPEEYQDALSFDRTNTGHGEEPKSNRSAAKRYGAELGSSEDEKLGRADREAIELSEWAGPGQPDRSDITPREPRSQESVRRQTLGNLLNDRRSWGKLKPRQREVVKLYAADGLTQSEIARQVGLDQASVCRMIMGALNLAAASS